MMHGSQQRAALASALSFPETTPTAALCAQVAQAQAHAQLFPTVPAGEALVVVVGVSGGADSVCLLHSLRHFAQLWQLALHVAHLDHGLRATSPLDAAFVAQLAGHWQLPYHHHQLAPGELAAHGGNLEAAARTARYAFLAQVAQQVTPASQEPIIALAHHADDQAETLLLHLARGTGLRGLSGMAPVSQRPIAAFFPAAAQPTIIREKHQTTLRLVRPFLHIRRTAILQSLQASGLPWREDESNQDEQLARNFVRHQILPHLARLNPQVVEALGRLATVASNDERRLAAQDQATLATLTLAPIDQSGQRLLLDLAALQALPVATQQGVLRQALLQLADTPELGLHQLTTLLALLQQPLTARGPHPLLGQIAWSVAPATATQPARLSLHDQTVLPFPPAHPYLDEPWRTTVGTAVVTPNGVVHGGDGWQLVSRMVAPAALPATWQQNPDPWQAYLDAQQVGELALTTPHTGQRFAPLGLQGQHKQVGDFFTDRKIHPTLRSGWPVLVDQHNGAIRWLCGLAIDHAARVTAATTHVLTLRWEQTNGR